MRRVQPFRVGVLLLTAAAGLTSLYLLLPACSVASADCPDPEDPSVRYVSRDPRACARLRFRCDRGQVPFSNDCGCGCLPAGGPEGER